MNIRKHWLAIFGVLALCLVVYFGLRNRKTTKDLGQPETSTETQPAHSNAVGQAIVNAPRVTVPNSASSSQPHPQSTPPKMTLEQKLEIAPNYMNVPISFYGRVVDQNGNPLSGVRVVISVRQWYHTPSIELNSTFPKTELTTDSSGHFQFLNGSGDSLQIEALEKEGYEAEPKALRGFGYKTSEPFNPDPNNPIVFRMWKSGTKQPLILGSKFLPVIPDGRVYTLDLLSGNLTEGEGEGDLRITIKRPPDAAWGKKYGWSFDLAAVNGGLKEETDTYESMFLAPQDDYAKDFAMEFHPEDERWTYGVNKRFYLKARNGKIFGRMEIEVDAYYLKDKQGRFGINYAVNPNGSPILR